MNVLLRSKLNLESSLTLVNLAQLDPALVLGSLIFFFCRVNLSPFNGVGETLHEPLTHRHFSKRNYFRQYLGLKVRWGSHDTQKHDILQRCIILCSFSANRAHFTELQDIQLSITVDQNVQGPVVGVFVLIFTMCIYPDIISRCLQVHELLWTDSKNYVDGPAINHSIWSNRQCVQLDKDLDSLHEDKEPRRLFHKREAAVSWT